MKRYKKEAKSLNPKEFLEMLHKRSRREGSPDWAEVQAGYRIYKEDGGKLSWEEFVSFFPDYSAPIEDRGWLEGKVRVIG